ncbi:putative glycerol-3-phosphate transporter 4 [Coffea arabica]|uniref:Glycerol-3-phosphate transporter 4 n=1 Tax=Coffea arabica TaxID=13443 RepID=A0A6P6U2I0_COFAR|nr:putative glycerol-3-phosphate transporter 4 [Coffea arabica]
MTTDGKTDHHSTRGNPPGISVIRRIRGKDWSFNTYSYVVLLVTFMAYTCYHASRKPSSIVKSVLYPEPNRINTTGTGYDSPWPIGDLFVKEELVSYNDVLKRGKHSKGWEPFNDEDGTLKLGAIDVAFLACYAIAMYFAGHVADSWDLRLFLSTGMIGSGIFVGLFGVGYFCNIHVFWFYLVMQMLAGLFQSTGWPSVVAVVGNWFGKKRRGLIMGIWNAHTSVGNICGSLLAASVLEYGWGWSFIVPGGFIFLGGIMVYLFLPAYPEDVGFSSPNSSAVKPVGVPEDQAVEVVTVPNDVEAQRGDEMIVVNEQSNVKPQIASTNRKSIGIVGAWRIPGVQQFAFCLFLAKLVAYTFLYWLPFYLSQTAIGGEYMSVKSAGNLSTLFDVGGIVGGILAGYISDKLKARATTATSFMFVAIPSLILYRIYGSISKNINIFLMIIAGLCVNGPYALITTAVSADLGTHSSLRGDSRALATVTALIDGTGSLGAALGPLLTGFLSKFGWDKVFGMLIICAAGAGLCLSRLVVNELHEKFSHRTVSARDNVEALASQPLLSGQR